MPVDRLTDMLIPYWQEAGYEFDPVADRAWLEQITTLIGASLTRLTDAVQMCRLFFVKSVDYTQDATEQLKQPGSDAVIQAMVTSLDNTDGLTEARAQEIVKQVIKQQNVKKGLVMRALRAALMGDMHGPDENWCLALRVKTLRQ